MPWSHRSTMVKVSRKEPLAVTSHSSPSSVIATIRREYSPGGSGPSCLLRDQVFGQTGSRQLSDGGSTWKVSV